jgi:hypothetical protein
MHEKDRFDKVIEQRDAAERTLQYVQDEHDGIARLYTTNAESLGDNPKQVLDKAKWRVGFWSQKVAVYRSTVIVLQETIIEMEEAGVAPWM